MLLDMQQTLQILKTLAASAAAHRASLGTHNALARGCFSGGRGRRRPHRWGAMSASKRDSQAAAARLSAPTSAGSASRSRSSCAGRSAAACARAPPQTRGKSGVT